MADCTRHTEHRRDRATGRVIGYDPRVNEWGPCETTNRGDHPMIRKSLTVAALAAAVVVAPGVANAVPGEPGQCTGTGVCTNEQPDTNLDGASMVVPSPSLADELRDTLAQALVDIFRGPSW